MEKIKEYELELQAKSIAGDTECNDGEVESFHNIRWLEARQTEQDKLIEEEQIALGEVVESYIVKKISTVTTLPEGSVPVIFHSPASASPRSNLIILTSDRELIFSGSTVVSDGAATPIEDTGTSLGLFPEESYGEFVKAAAHGDIVTLLFERRLCWLVYDAVANTYSVRRTLPSAPEVEFVAENVTMSPYVTTVGGSALLSVRVAIGHLDSTLTYSELADWIDGGAGGRIAEEIKAVVNDAVAEKVTEYLEEVDAKGYTTGLLTGVAAWSSHLPGARKTIGNYSEPTLKIGSWGYSEGLLSFRLYLSVTPQEVWCTYRITETAAMWSDVFSRLEFYLLPLANWWGNRVEITGFTTIVEGDKRTRGFYIKSLSRTEILESAAETAKYFKAGSVAVSSVSEGVMRLQLSVMRNASASFMPDYDERSNPLPSDMIGTDEGFVGSASNIVMRQSNDCPVLFTHLTKVGDRGVFGLMPSCLKRSASESGLTPIYAFCEDGIRLLGSNGDGGYGVSQMLSRDAVTGKDRAAMTSRGAAVHTKQGFRLLTSSSVASFTSQSYPAESSDIRQVLYHAKSEALWVLTYGAQLYIMDEKNDAWRLSETPLFRIMSHLGEHFGIDNFNRLNLYGAVRVKQTVNTSKLTAKAVAAEEGDSNIYVSSLLTRPLKFDDASRAKKIQGFRLIEENARWILEASNDARKWSKVAKGGKKESGRLHTPACRFWRLRLYFSDEAAADRVRRLSFRIEI